MVDEARDRPGQADRERARRTFDDNPLHQLLGLTIEEARPSFARLRMRTNRITGGQGETAEGGGVGGSVHGGLLAAMVDIAALQAVLNSLQPGDRPAGTADLNITYLRPALGEQICADATILRKGRQLIIIDVSITDPAGRLCSKARVIYALRREDPVADGV
jgi:uncharacterized protein (TIGR00369 family)